MTALFAGAVTSADGCAVLVRKAPMVFALVYMPARQNVRTPQEATAQALAAAAQFGELRACFSQHPELDETVEPPLVPGIDLRVIGWDEPREAAESGALGPARDELFRWGEYQRMRAAFPGIAGFAAGLCLFAMASLGGKDAN